MRVNYKEFKVPYLAQGSTYSEQELDAVRMVLESGETLSCGRERKAFEEEFAKFIGVDAKRVVATSSCTVALEIATYLANLQPGDNVVVTPQSYQATLNPLLSLDIEVRFGDIDRETLCLDPLSLKNLVNKRTKAIFITHYGGLMVNLDRLSEVLADSNVLIIEDCAHSHGSSFAGKRPGSTGNIACYSFQSMKNMSTLGQGGMMILPEETMAKRVRRLIAVEPDASFSSRYPNNTLEPYHPSPPSVFTHDKNAFTHDCSAIFRHGTNSTLPEPAAAVGRVQLRRLSEFLARRQCIASMLDTLLAEILGVRLQVTPSGYVHSHHLYTCFIDAPINNHVVAAAMIERGIEIQQRYFPLHLLPEWRARGGYVGQCPIAEEVWFEKQLNLPIYPAMTDEQVEYIALTLHKVVRGL